MKSDFKDAWPQEAAMQAQLEKLYPGYDWRWLGDDYGHLYIEGRPRYISDEEHEKLEREEREVRWRAENLAGLATARGR